MEIFRYYENVLKFKRLELFIRHICHDITILFIKNDLTEESNRNKMLFMQLALKRMEFKSTILFTLQKRKK